MKALVIEAEPHSVRRLIRMLWSLRPELQTPDPLHSIEAAAAWLNANPRPDLIFMDIEL